MVPINGVLQVVTGNKIHPDFHIPDWMSMIVDVTSVGRRDKKWFLKGPTSSVQSTVNCKDSIVRSISGRLFSP